MLIETITFEVRNFTTGEAEEFLVENTELNFAVIASQKNTRGIHFTKTFDFQFARARKAPKFIEFAEIVESALENAEEIDLVDEMVGSF